MPKTDAEVDRLYQLPLQEFTPERDALAKRRGASGADVRGLQKPNLPAWAVNQLFWHRRKAFDRLIVTSERLRRAHGARLGGKTTAVADEERAHQAALAVAMDEASAVLAAAGHAASPDTMMAVSETLQALPVDAPIGRLSRPIKSTGFGLVASILEGGGEVRTPKADVVSFKRKCDSSEDEESARPRRINGEDERATRARERAAAKARAVRERQALATAVREQRVAERDDRVAQAAVTRARQELERVQRDRERLENELEAATAQRDAARAEVTRTTRAATDAALVRRQIDERVTALRGRSATIGARGVRRGPDE
jgi:hypothetical protein